MKMANLSEVPKLAAGAFFGEARHIVATPSFQFSALQATVPERQVPRHSHETPHFILVMSGVYVTEARNQNGVCLRGALIFNPAGTTHRDCFRSPKGTFLSITPNQGASQLLERATPVPLVVNEKSASGKDNRSPDDLLIARRIVRKLQRGIECSTMALDGLGLELIGLLANIQDRTASREAPRWLVHAKEMIEDCAEQDCAEKDLSIEELACLAGVHPVYLARAYRRYFRCSPGEYLRQCRLRRVQGLLSRTDLPLVEIALRCGFSDQSQMTRSFSSSFGVPPARYRCLLRKR
jgi:AraC family transcriptional regulator